MEFETLAAQSGWNEPALLCAFRRGLNDQVRGVLVAGAQPRDLAEMVDRAIEPDNYQHEWRWERFSRLVPLRFSACPLLGAVGLPQPWGVFSKQWALSLLPHRPYDCAIDLRPGAPVPSSRLYKLSRPEHKAMESYVSDSLASGLIVPSSSPVRAGFFFVKKKDGTL